MWRPRAPARLVTQLSFLDFMLVRRSPHVRPTARGLKRSTARHYERLAQQILRDAALRGEPLEHDVPPAWRGRGDLTAERVAHQVSFSKPVVLADPSVPVLQSWEKNAPAWRAFYTMTSGGHPRFEAHRKAMLWYAAFHGQAGDDAPAFVRTTWSTEADYHEAVAAGEIAARTLHLDVRRDIPTLLAARPFESIVLEEHARKGPHARFRKTLERKLVHARIKDAMWRSCVWTMFILCRRPQDMVSLRFRNVLRDPWRIRAWQQSKKYGREIRGTVPERWAVGDAGNNVPSLRWFVERVSPLIPGPMGPDAPVFRNMKGDPFTDNSFRAFISEGMRRALVTEEADDTAAGHGLRRAGATWRFRWGWTLAKIAWLLDDTEEVAKGYIDDAWVTEDGGPSNVRHRTQTPQVPMLRARLPGGNDAKGGPRPSDQRRKRVVLPGFEPGSEP